MRPPQYPRDEDRVIDAFTQHLKALGWSIVRSRPSFNEPDIVATRGTERLIGEAKGRTSAPRTDIDTMYGQLLRRMTSDRGTTYAAVLPSAFVLRALDVAAEVRERLGIRIFEVTDDDRVVGR